MDEINHHLAMGSPSSSSGPQTPKEEDKKPKRSGMTSSGETKIIRDKSSPDNNGKKDPSSTENKKKTTTKQSVKKIPKEKPATPKRKSSRGKPPAKKGATGENLEGSEEDPSLLTVPAANHPAFLRTHSRKSYGLSPVTTENIQELSKQIEELQKNINEKEKELSLILIEKNKVDTVVNKLNMDVRATHLLIESLQKESLYHLQNREKLVTGNSLFAKHQKKN